MPVKKLKPEIFEPRLFELPMNGERLPIQDTTPFYPVYKTEKMFCLKETVLNG